MIKVQIIITDEQCGKSIINLVDNSGSMSEAINDAKEDVRYNLAEHYNSRAELLGDIIQLTLDQEGIIDL